jgi:hypothetical protein
VSSYLPNTERNTPCWRKKIAAQRYVHSCHSSAECFPSVRPFSLCRALARACAADAVCVRAGGRGVRGAW